MRTPIPPAVCAMDRNAVPTRSADSDKAGFCFAAASFTPETLPFMGARGGFQVSGVGDDVNQRRERRDRGE